MPTLPESRIVELLEPYLTGTAAPRHLYKQLSDYLDLLLRWNARTNLTAIREPEEIVQRHFGESLFAGIHLRSVLIPSATLLDYGSGAGLPGIPLQLLLPELRCCLAESQGKKSAFLREAVRTLGLAIEVWASRAETMPLDRRFDCVALRAVDNMEAAVTEAQIRVSRSGVLAILGSSEAEVGVLSELSLQAKFPVPGSHSRMLYLYSHSEMIEV